MLNRQQLKQFGVTIWSIWNGRNGELFQEERKQAHVAAAWIKQYILDYNAYMVSGEVRVANRGKWKAPGSDQFKVNFDGDVDKKF